VTEPVTLAPETPKVTFWMSEPLLLMATMANAPFDGFLKAATP
jgi:hypothetical protein